MCLSLWVVSIALFGGTADAQTADPMPEESTVVARFATGNGPGQIGVVADTPERSPEGPAAIAATPNSSDIFVLDSVNKRVVRVLPQAEPLPGFDIPDADRVRALMPGSS
jgi:hypothetical protein